MYRDHTHDNIESYVFQLLRDRQTKYRDLQHMITPAEIPKVSVKIEDNLEIGLPKEHLKYY